MVENFASFTTTFLFLALLIFLGIVFEKQLIALEDKFDAYVASKLHKNKVSRAKKQTAKKTSCSNVRKSGSNNKNGKYSHFAA